MDQPMRDFTDLLLTRGVISLEQLSEAKTISKREDKQIGDCLVSLDYASSEEVTQALAEFYKFEYVDLSGFQITLSNLSPSQLLGKTRSSQFRTRMKRSKCSFPTLLISKRLKNSGSF
jgi:hypothetical protein